MLLYECMGINMVENLGKQAVDNSNRHPLEEMPSFEKHLEGLVQNDEEVKLPPMPSQIPVGDDLTEEQRRANDKKAEKQQKYIDAKLKEYNITPEEWEEVSAYKGSGYFIPSSVLRDVDLFKLHIPDYGGMMERQELLQNPKELLDSYCKMYSAMCKFGKKNKRPILIKRVDSGLFTNERMKSRETESFLSFTSSEDDDYDFMFVGDKGPGGTDAVLLEGRLDAGLPCISFPEITKETTDEAEILIPPFLSIEYGKETGEEESGYPVYHIEISKKDNAQIPTLSPERKQQVLNSDIAYRYYSKWYSLRRSYSFDSYPDEEKEEYNHLRTEFLAWQADFKNILCTEFSDIEKQIQLLSDEKWSKFFTFLGRILGRTGGD